MLLRPSVRCVVVCVALTVLASPALADPNIVIKQAPPLPPPPGTVIDVNTVGGLYTAINTATSGQTIRIAAGTYNLTSVPQLNRAGVTIRGATGNRDDVVLVGGGMNTQTTGRSNYGFHVNVSNITIADLTIRDVYSHGIQIRGENNVSNVLLHNLKILNAGERHIKGSTGTGRIADSVTIEYCHLEQTLNFVSRPGNTVDPDNYIGGIDAIGINNWQVRDCYFKDIRGLTGGGRGAIFLWGGVTNTVAERNCVIGCDRGIAFGNPYRTVPYHSTNSIIRNNFVVGGAGYAMELCASNNLNVYNNTVYCSNAGANAIHVFDSVTTGLKLYSNIIRGQIFFNSASGDTTGSIVGATPQVGWFIEPLVGDLRLTSLATPAINQGQVLPEVTNDFFGLPRDSTPDIGGYEFVTPVPPQVTAVTPVLAQVQHKSAALNTITIAFSKDVVIADFLVSVNGVSSGTHNNFTFYYDSASKTATLQYAAGLPNDTYVVAVSDAVSDVELGLALDGEEDLLSPSLPSGDGTAGGSFSGVLYRLVGDITGDRKVNVFDLQRLAATWNKQQGQAGYDAVCDLTGDGKVNVFDLQALAGNWNQTIPVAP